MTRFAQKKNKDANLTTALNAVLAGQAPPVVEAVGQGHDDRLPGPQAGGGVQEDLLRHGRRPDPRRQVRRLPHAGRHGPVRDEQLRSGQGLRADDPRSAASPSACLRTTPTATARSGSTTCVSTDKQLMTVVNWIEAGARAAKASTRCRQPPSPRRNGRWASRIWSRRSRPSTFRLPASSTIRPVRRPPASPKANG